MTDKELRKLSRLELLELLLEAGKENEKLKKEIETLKVENRTAESIEQLSTATKQIENALEYANSITDTLKNSPEGTSPTVILLEKDGTKKEVPATPDTPSDQEIYRQLLNHFLHNDEALNSFPDYIQRNVRTRIKSILEKRSIK